MNTLIKLWQALSTLTARVSSLAETVGAIDAGLRQRAGLDGVEPLLLPDSTGDSPAGTTGGNGQAAGRRRKAKAE
jgi:hypothetical protein